MLNHFKNALVFCLLLLAFSFACQPAFALVKVNLNTASVDPLIEMNYPAASCGE